MSSCKVNCILEVELIQSVLQRFQDIDFHNLLCLHLYNKTGGVGVRPNPHGTVKVLQFP